MTTTTRDSAVAAQLGWLQISEDGCGMGSGWFRVISIMIGTYIAAMILLWIIQVPNPYLGALVPALGFLLSTQSLPALKRWWIRQYFR